MVFGSIRKKNIKPNFFFLFASSLTMSCIVWTFQWDVLGLEDMQGKENPCTKEWICIKSSVEISKNKMQSIRKTPA